ncbi:MAG: methylenetetrahydrofolate reductase C-terminal domain-containing protein [Nitrospirota bacterium]
MIVGKQKPISEIWDMIKDFKKIIVFGCNTCVAVCHAGGSKEAEILASLLRIKALQEGVDMTVESGACERQCEPEFIQQHLEALKAHDLVLSIGCGAGVNLLSAYTGNTPVFPGLNTEFYGAVQQAGHFIEVCGGCGNCILHLTGGICPIVRCSKSLLNGPCGGTNNGKCEINSEQDCAWCLIIERMKQLDKLEQLFAIQPPKDWSRGTYGGPREVIVEHIAADEKNSVGSTKERKS